MKKVLLFLLTAALIMTLCACASTPAQEQQAAPAAPSETPAPAEPADPAPAETPAPSATAETPAETEPLELPIQPNPEETTIEPDSGNAPAPSSSGVTEDAAKQIAFSDAGAAGESAVTELRVKQDRDDGRQVYEIEFLYNDVKYDYDVDAATGEITEASGKFRGTLQSAQGDVGETAAVDAALADAGFARNQVTGLYVKTDYEKGRLVYEIEFYKDAFEYDYVVDAATGVITEWERSL